MYQIVGIEAIVLLGKCLNVPIYTFESKCRAINTDLDYSENSEDEVEDLYNALKNVSKELCFSTVSSGAVLSNYQKNRVENVCKRLCLTSLAPLWKRDQKELLSEMIEYGMEAIIIKIASPSLGKECLNMKLNQIKSYMDNKKFKYEMNYCGEGGEYESFTLNCKHFIKQIVVNEYEILGHPEENGREDGVYYLKMTSLSIIDK